jgi:hypothetical protein
MDSLPVSPANHANKRETCPEPSRTDEFKKSFFWAAIRVIRGPKLDSGLVKSARIADG